MRRGFVALLALSAKPAVWTGFLTFTSFRIRCPFWGIFGHQGDRLPIHVDWPKRPAGALRNRIHPGLASGRQECSYGRSGTWIQSDHRVSSGAPTISADRCRFQREFQHSVGSHTHPAQIETAAIQNPDVHWDNLSCPTASDALASVFRTVAPQVQRVHLPAMPDNSFLRAAGCRVLGSRSLAICQRSDSDFVSNDQTILIQANGVPVADQPLRLAFRDSSIMASTEFEA